MRLCYSFASSFLYVLCALEAVDESESAQMSECKRTGSAMRGRRLGSRGRKWASNCRLRGNCFLWAESALVAQFKQLVL